jgi:hypothetical protein
VRVAPELLGAPTVGWGVPGPGVVVERVEKSDKPSMQPKIYENGMKTALFGL